ncbi:MAG: protease inhibitor I42 family protein [bacterium]
MDGRIWYSRGIVATLLSTIVTLVAITSAGCGSSANAAGGPLTLRETDNNKAYTVKVGDTIEVTIPGNPTTGFSWTAALTEKDAALVRQVGEPAYAPERSDSMVLGAGGVYTFTFKAAAKGKALLRLVYARPWESVEPEQTFAVTLAIE